MPLQTVGFLKYNRSQPFIYAHYFLQHKFLIEIKIRTIAPYPISSLKGNRNAQVHFQLK